MIDFLTPIGTMTFTGPEDRALLGSNPSAAAGDGNNRKSKSYYRLLLHPNALRVVLVRKAINPPAPNHSTGSFTGPYNPTGLPYGNIFDAKK